MAVFSSETDQSNPSSTRTSAPGAPSVVGPGTRFVGDLESGGLVRVEGRLEGSISSEHQVLVTDGGVVAGDIRAPEVVIGGEVHGNIVSPRRVELHPGGHVHGDVTAPRVVIRDGGRVNGRLQMVDVEHRQLRLAERSEATEPEAALRTA